MNKMIERALKIGPESMRTEGRALLQSMLENDPTLSDMLRDLRTLAIRLTPTAASRARRRSPGRARDSERRRP